MVTMKKNKEMDKITWLTALVRQPFKATPTVLPVTKPNQLHKTLLNLEVHFGSSVPLVEMLYKNDYKRHKSSPERLLNKKVVEAADGKK